MLKLLKKLQAILPAKDKLKVVILVFFMLVAGFLEVLSIAVLSGFVAGVADPDLLLNNKYLAFLFNYFNIVSHRQILIYGTISLISIFLFKNLYLIAYKYLKARFIINRYRSISGRLFKIYMNIPYSFHLNRNSADLIRNVSSEASSVANSVISSLLQMATEIIMTIIIIILLLIVEPIVTIFSLVILGGVSFLFLRFTKKKMKYFGEKAITERSKIIKTINEGIGGFKEITIMNRQSWFTKKFDKSILNLSKAQIYNQITKQSVHPIIETIAIAGILIIAIFLLSQGHSLASLAATLALFALSIKRLLPAINNIISEYNSLRYHVFSVDKVYQDIIQFKEYEHKNREISQKENYDQEKTSFLRNKIELKNIQFKYNDNQALILDNISLTISQGQAIGLVGKTGSGKTTLVDLILGLLKPSKGSIEVDKKDIYTNLNNWQKNIGYIPQFIYLADDSIRNNIALGLNEKDIDDKKIKKAIKVAQLTELINELPNRENTKIGERGIRLSGGQRQRIGIARALYHNPEVLVMDEATSSLDNITEKFIIQAIEELKKDRTIIIIAHRLSTVRNCDQLYILDKGKVVSQGTYQELIKNSQDFKEMVEDKS